MARARLGWHRVSFPLFELFPRLEARAAHCAGCFPDSGRVAPRRVPRARCGRQRRLGQTRRHLVARLRRQQGAHARAAVWRGARAWSTRRSCDRRVRIEPRAGHRAARAAGRASSPGALLFPQPVSRGRVPQLGGAGRSGARLHALPHWSALPFGMAWMRTQAEPAPYVMAPGGATPLGALGYVSAGLELGRQIAAGELPVPRRIDRRRGSTCTSAGLLVGLALGGPLSRRFRACNAPWLTSVRVSPWPVTSRFRILSLAARTRILLHELSGAAVPPSDARRSARASRSTGATWVRATANRAQRAPKLKRCGGVSACRALDGTYSAKARRASWSGCARASRARSCFGRRNPACRCRACRRRSRARQRVCRCAFERGYSRADDSLGRERSER